MAISFVDRTTIIEWDSSGENMEELEKKGEQLETCSIEFGQSLAQWIGIGQHHHLLSGAERGVAAGKVVVVGVGGKSDLGTAQ